MCAVSAEAPTVRIGVQSAVRPLREKSADIADGLDRQNDLRLRTIGGQHSDLIGWLQG